MNGARFPQRDADTVRLRTMVADIERELSLFSTSESDGAPSEPLRRSWAELVELLALGPAPETRECPICGHIAMRAATLCGNCWNRLSPLSAASRDARATTADQCSSSMSSGATGK